MDTIVSMLGHVLGYIMAWCYKIANNYGIAIIIFTFIMKIILLPISILIHMNSIKMVKMQPELNFIKADYFGDSDKINEEQLKLYKKYNYRPMLGLVPLFIQIILLMGVIDVIYKPLKHIFRIPAELIDNTVQIFSSLSGMSTEVKSIQIAIVDSLKNGLYADELQSILGIEQIAKIKILNMNFLGINLAGVPSRIGGILILIPILAAFCAWLLCVVQNKVSVLQSEQGRLNKTSTMLFSVGLSLYLGFFVPAGVGIYWMCGNLFAILQLFFLNWIISPKKYIDYEQLEASKIALEKKSRRSKANKKFFERDPYRNKEKQDYKAFYKIYNKQLVFYSEKNGFYKYFQNVIEYLLENSDIVIDYVTNDPNDAIFEKTSDRFRTYYIGNKKIISFMMKMDANVVVMTTPDLEKYHIKRSMVRKDIEYIYLPHGITCSPNRTLRPGALDYFDTYFSSSPHAEREIRAIEKLHNVKEKTIVAWGSSVLDNMIEAYKNMPKDENETKSILIAPSWQEDNIIDICIEDLLDELLTTEHRVILRPHPQYLRYAMDRIEELESKYSSYPNFMLEKDFSSIETVYKADLLITDWSGIAIEYTFSTLKPVLSINTPMKVVNPEWKEIDIEPLDIKLRKLIGMDLDLDNISSIKTIAEELLNSADAYREKIRQIRETELYNVGNSGKTGAEYIMKAIERVEENKEEYLKYL